MMWPVRCFSSTTHIFSLCMPISSCPNIKNVRTAQRRHDHMWAARPRIHAMSRVLLLLLLLSRQCGGADDEALRHLLLGNEFAGQGKHIEAVEAWR